MKIWSGPFYKFKKSGESIKSRIYPRIFFSALFLAILLLAFFITRPFLPAILAGAIIAYLAYPFYEKTLKYIKNKNLASLVVTIFIILILTLPFIFVLSIVSKEAYYTYKTLNQHNLGTNFLKIICKDENWLLCKAAKSFTGFLPDSDLDFYMQVTIKKITEFIIQNVSQFLATVPAILLKLFVMMFVVYYLLKDGQAIGGRVKNMLPLKGIHKQHVLDKFHEITYATFYGNIFVALLQGVLGGIGFLVLGVPSPILWGFVMSLFALLPYFGTAIIWLPAALNLIFIGYLQNDSSSTINGLILVIYGVFVISSIDNILKPKLIGTKANVHPILVLLGVLGGLNMFGFIGIILGPVMLALLMTFVNIYENKKAELEKHF